jgi:hypothetical protein
MRETRPDSLLNPNGGCLWAGIGGIAGVLLLGLIVVLSIFNRGAVPLETPSITIIPRSTDTPLPFAPTTQSTDESEATEVPFEDVLYVGGDLVEVTGTGGEGLRLRNSPSLNGVINVLALENEVFEIKGGPAEADGYTWWFLVNPYDNQIQGWGVTNYLRLIGP